MTHTPLPWIIQEVTDSGQTYRVTSETPNPEEVPHGKGWGDGSDYDDRLIFHDQSYYPMSPNKEDAQFIVNACNSYYTHLAEIDMLKEKNKELFKALSKIAKGTTANGVEILSASDMKSIAEQTIARNKGDV